MTPKQFRRQKHREGGRYAQVNPCYVCGKSAGEQYFSHPDSDHLINDELLCLCQKCIDKYGKIPGPEAVRLAFPERKT